MIPLLLIFLPLLSAGILFLFRKSESGTGRISLILSKTQAALFLWALAGRLLGRIPADLEFGTILHFGPFHLDAEFLLDDRALCILGLSSFLYGIIFRFARVYMHREEGFGRFFRTLFLSQFGLCLLATAGNPDLLFAAWEVIGLTSFLLIAFYRDRATPVLNAFRTYIVYRICDVGILTGAWLLRENSAIGDRFHSVDLEAVASLTRSHPGIAFALGLSFLIPALGKSAQFPFSFWLPRALEGPTPSSAVFYGALSIHAGIFLLLRTEEIWLQIPAVRLLIFVFGAASLVTGTLSGRAQANIKGQIGYASIAQVGIMFMEAALGWTHLVLIHLCSHAVLRTYQFLISPSVVTHFIRHPVPEHRGGFFGFSHHPWIRRLSIGEFFLEDFWSQSLLGPLQRTGRSGMAFTLLLVLGWVLVWILARETTPLFLLVPALLFSIRATGVPAGDRPLPWLFASLVLTILASALPGDTALVLRVCAFGVIPGMILWFAGSGWPRLLGWLCLAGFPISPFFAGDDLMVHGLGAAGPAALVLFIPIFILNGVVLAREFVHSSWLQSARPLD